MRGEQPLLTLAGIKLKRYVIGVQPLGPQRDQGTQRVCANDGVQVLRVLDGEMCGDVHRAFQRVGVND